MAGQRRGRGRLSSIDLLPREADDIIVWAAGELAKRERTLTDIYGEFHTRLIALQGDQGLAFDIPAFSSFHRYSMAQAKLAREMEESNQIMATLAGRLDGIGDEDATVVLIALVKSIIVRTIQGRDHGSFDAEEILFLSRSLQQLVASSRHSTAQRQLIQSKVDAAKEEAIDKAEVAAREAGVSAERIAQMRREFLGVRPQKPGEVKKLDTEE